MNVAIMQPYFFPYLGYYQLAAAVDQWIFYDDVMYMKGGYINRNFILLNGKPHRFTIPVQDQSSFRAINAHEAILPFDKIANNIRNAYRKAPNYAQVMPLIEEVISGGVTNIAELAEMSIVKVMNYLGRYFSHQRSSSLKASNVLKSQDRVLAICSTVAATKYINPIGGVSLYKETDFIAREIQLRFHRMDQVQYSQNGVTEFVPNLSMIDVLMYCSISLVNDLLTQYAWINPLEATASEIRRT